MSTSLALSRTIKGSSNYEVYQGSNLESLQYQLWYRNSTISAKFEKTNITWTLKIEFLEDA